jgi:hypothetical protein
MTYTFKQFVGHPELGVGTATFPSGLDTSGCGLNTDLSTNFPAFDTTAAQAETLHTLTWRGGVIATTAAALGLASLGQSGLDCGPVVSTEPTTGTTLVWSTLDWHKIVPQRTTGTVYSMGIAAAIPELPIGFNYSIMFAASPGGATAGVYSWGDLIQKVHGTTRIPSVTLTDIGYYTVSRASLPCSKLRCVSCRDPTRALTHTTFRFFDFSLQDDGAYYYGTTAHHMTAREKYPASITLTVFTTLRHLHPLPIQIQSGEEEGPTLHTTQSSRHGSHRGHGLPRLASFW